MLFLIITRRQQKHDNIKIYVRYRGNELLTVTKFDLEIITKLTLKRCRYDLDTIPVRDRTDTAKQLEAIRWIGTVSTGCWLHCGVIWLHISLN